MGEDLMGDWETAMDEDLIGDWGAAMRLMEEFESAEGLGGSLKREKGFLKSGMRAFLRRNSARQNLPVIATQITALVTQVMNINF